MSSPLPYELSRRMPMWLAAVWSKWLVSCDPALHPYDDCDQYEPEFDDLPLITRWWSRRIWGPSDNIPTHAIWHVKMHERRPWLYRTTMILGVALCQVRRWKGYVARARLAVAACIRTMRLPVKTNALSKWLFHDARDVMHHAAFETLTWFVERDMRPPGGGTWAIVRKPQEFLDPTYMTARTGIMGLGRCGWYAPRAYSDKYKEWLRHYVWWIHSRHNLNRRMDAPKFLCFAGLRNHSTCIEAQTRVHQLVHVQWLVVSELPHASTTATWPPQDLFAWSSSEMSHRARRVMHLSEVMHT